MTQYFGSVEFLFSYFLFNLDEFPSYLIFEEERQKEGSIDDVRELVLRFALLFTRGTK